MGLDWVRFRKNYKKVSFKYSSSVPMEIKIGNRLIGDGHPALVTAEIGQNHNGDMDIAKKLINLAHEHKVDAVKFCKRSLNLTLPKELNDAPYIGPNSFGNTYGEHRRNLELSEEDYEELSKYCKKKGLIFHASVCDEDSADLLDDLGAPLFKIASRDLINMPLLEYVAKKGKPVIISTGMSTLREIDDAVKLVKKYNDKLIINYCVSAYPSNYDDIDFGYIPFFRNRYKTLIGYSGHTIGILMPTIAVAFGACAIEKHITLSRIMKGTDHPGSLEPLGLMRVARDIRNTEKSVKGRRCTLNVANMEKNILKSESSVKQRIGKSLCTKVPLNKGEEIKPEMLCVKTMGGGLSPRLAPFIVKGVPKEDIQTDKILREGDIDFKFPTDGEISDAVSKFEWNKLLWR